MLLRPEGPRQTSRERLIGRNITTRLVGNLGIEAFQHSAFVYFSQGIYNTGKFKNGVLNLDK